MYDDLCAELEQLRDAVQMIDCNDPQYEEKVAYLAECIEQVEAELNDMEADYEF